MFTCAKCGWKTDTGGLMYCPECDKKRVGESLFHVTLVKMPDGLPLNRYLVRARTHAEADKRFRRFAKKRAKFGEPVLPKSVEVWVEVVEFDADPYVTEAV